MLLSIINKYIFILLIKLLIFKLFWSIIQYVKLSIGGILLKRIIRKLTALIVSLLLIFSFTSVLGSAASSDIFTISGTVLTKCSSSATGVIDYIPSTVTEIKGNAFSGCNAITEVVIPSSVTKIGSNAFDSCTSLKKVSIQGTNCEIGSAAFLHCSAMTEIKLPSKLAAIPNEAFSDCRDLKAIAIPSTVTLIGTEAFANCESLSIIRIPASVKTIRANAFLGCKGISKFDVDSGNTVYSSINGVLYGPLESPYDPDINYEANTEKTLINYPAGASATSFAIPSGVVRIAEDAFNSNKVLKNVTLPNGIKSIGSHAFFSCTALESINIPSTVTEIGSRAFDGCTALKSITIPASVTTFENAFSYSGLTSVVIENGVKTISTGAFSYCTKLASVTIPESVTSIEAGAFGGCPESMEIICEKDSYAYSYAVSNGFKVKVNSSAEKTVKSITISEYPDKTDYIYKESINTSGLVLTVEYSDGTTAKATDGYTISPEKITKTGNQSIKVTYGDANAYFDVSASYAWWQMIIMIILLGFLWY